MFCLCLDLLVLLLATHVAGFLLHVEVNIGIAKTMRFYQLLIYWNRRVVPSDERIHSFNCPSQTHFSTVQNFVAFMNF